MTKKARAIDVKFMGVDVRVVHDEDGRPLFATASAWGDENAAHAQRAAQHVIDTAERAVASKKRERETIAAWEESARVRNAAIAEHPATAWLALAYDEDPKRGRKKLAHAAQSLAVAANVVLKDDDEITEDRARRFLKRLRNPGQ